MVKEISTKGEVPFLSVETALQKQIRASTAGQ